ncbi:hypothetical protein ACLOJK_006133 [Asimina triloba]
MEDEQQATVEALHGGENLRWSRLSRSSSQMEQGYLQGLRVPSLPVLVIQKAGLRPPKGQKRRLLRRESWCRILSLNQVEPRRSNRLGSNVGLLGLMVSKYDRLKLIENGSSQNDIVCRGYIKHEKVDLYGPSLGNVSKVDDESDEAFDPSRMSYEVYKGCQMGKIHENVEDNNIIEKNKDAKGVIVGVPNIVNVIIRKLESDALLGAL